MLHLLFLWMFTIINEGQCSISLGTLMKSTSSCFQLSTVITNFSKEMNASCLNGQVISIESSTTSAHPISDSCTKEVIATSNDTYQKCCQTTSDECIYDFHFNPLNTLQTPNQLCNGKQTCSLPVYNVDLNQHCNGADLPASGTHYMHLNYYCIESSKIVKGCNAVMMSSNVPGSAVYLQSQNFPDAVNANSGCSCSIESDACDSGIDLVTIQRVFLPENDNSCKQNLQLNFEDSSIFIDWDCSDSSVEITQLSTTETYLNLTYVNSLATAEGTFWLGFQSTSSLGNITINCPAHEKQLCLVSSTISSDMSSTIDLSPTPTMTQNISMFDNSSIEITSSHLLPTSINLTTFSQMSSSASETLGISSAVFSETVTPTAVVTTIFPEQSSQEAQDSEWKHIAIIALALLAALFILVVVVISCLLYARTKDTNQDTLEKESKVTGTFTVNNIGLTKSDTSTEPSKEPTYDTVDKRVLFTLSALNEEKDLCLPTPPDNTFFKEMNSSAQSSCTTESNLGHASVSLACQTEMAGFCDKSCQTEKKKRHKKKSKVDPIRIHP